jgi:hypothetical protein
MSGVVGDEALECHQRHGDTSVSTRVLVMYVDVEGGVPGSHRRSHGARVLLPQVPMMRAVVELECREVIGEDVAHGC